MRVTTLTSEIVFYAFLYAVVDTMCTRVIYFLDEVDAVDEIVLLITEGERSDTLKRLTSTCRVAGRLRASMTVTETIVRTLMSQQYANCFSLRHYYRDVLDDVIQTTHRLEQARDVLTQANNNVVSVLSMLSAEHANETNDVMKHLAIIGGIMMPLNLIASIFGMNMRIPYESGKGGEQGDRNYMPSGPSCAAYAIDHMCSLLLVSERMEGKRIAIGNDWQRLARHDFRKYFCFFS